MTTLVTATSLLDSWFDFSAFPDDEPNGVTTTGEPSRSLRRIGYAVNSSFEVIDDAVRQGVDLLLTHHGLGEQEHPELAHEKRGRLQNVGIAHYVCHLPLDCAGGFGTASTLCALLGVREEGAFLDIGGGHRAGRFGVLEPAVTLNAFVARLSEALGVAPYVLLGSPRVRRVGVVTGGGGNTTYLEEARRLGCDTYVTGEGSLYTKLYARETGLNLLLATHTASERPGIEALAKRLAGALPGVEAVGLRETPFE